MRAHLTKKIARSLITKTGVPFAALLFCGKRAPRSDRIIYFETSIDEYYFEWYNIAVTDAVIFAFSLYIVKEEVYQETKLYVKWE